MIQINWKPSKRQYEAWKILQDKKTTEVLFGGGAGGGKSYLGCVWILTSCLQYPGTRWLIGRAHLKSLKESTLLTFFRICKDWGLKAGEDYKYNSMDSTIKFSNESAIYLKDLFAYPADPEFDELGSTEYTGAFIDEASQIYEKAYNIVMSRLRYRLDECNLIPKMLTATNPTKNFIYANFYRPHKEGKLMHYKAFVPALVYDNPYISTHYIENLKKLDNVSRERLLHGNWEYNDDPSILFEYEKILDIFTNINRPHPKDHRHYITCDVARFGDDKTVICVWWGLEIIQMYWLEKASTREVRLKLEDLAGKFNIPRSNIAIDEDGIGGGIVDEMGGVKGFVNNSRAFERPIKPNQLIKHNFANLKSQCYFLLAEYVNEGKIGCQPVTPEVKKLIIADLEQIKRKDHDKDGRLQVIGKDEIKESLQGRSPDFGDAMMMRMLWEVRPVNRSYISMR